MVVTSPSHNVITVLQVPEGNVVGTVEVGPQPYSVVCYVPSSTSGPQAVVSNLGDNSLALVDIESLKVISRIPDVPGSRGFHGLTVYGNPENLIAWVAGTDANVVSLVNLGTRQVLTRFPLGRPTAVGNGVFIASSSENKVTFFNPSLLRVESVLSVPNPQDFVEQAVDSYTYLATMGSANSIFRITSFPAPATETIPGIPGAAAAVVWRTSSLENVTLVTSPDSNQLFFVRKGPRAPGEFGVSNGATFSGPIAPGSLTTAFATTGVSQNFVADSLPLRTSLGGVTLRVGGSLTFDGSRWVYSGTGAVAAPLLFVGPTQTNFQIPLGLSPVDMVPVQLSRPDGSTLLSNFRLTATAPGIFTLLANGQGQGAVLNQDNSLNFGTRPAARGSVIQIFATGAGATNPPLLAGEPAPASGNPLVLTQVQPAVTIGGRPARVLFSGMAPGYVGLWQINAEVPMDVAPGPAVSLVITAGGVQSNTVTIAIQ